MDAAPHVNYISNRQGALEPAVVAAAAITMPRQDGALRGTVESQSQAMSNAAEANTMASAALSATAAAAIAAATGAGGATSISESLVQQLAIQAGISAATAIAGQLAHAVSPKSSQTEDGGEVQEEGCHSMI